MKGTSKNVEDLAEDVVFGFNGRGMGVPALGDVISERRRRPAANIGDLIAAWKFN